ncbi:MULTISPECIES: response regulator transcription factor [unclassified Pseudomonas]|uniref:response regulator transcription factor n=1 Tax=unclassified Pseudomonas TaxID=196821 RepID=UPI0011A31122|nr:MULTISPECIES: response regulator transcription factor [unclassified Pseudomonas]TWC18829.1 LuxR family two component transcriptional regulator [Pseudomonas sp. SJZ083]TWC46085.1 LuxR family two component transcriptional regulator [Pseudomonas sp. SJZ077]
MHKALVVDDHPFIRAAVKVLLEREQFEVIFEADNGVDAVQMARQHTPALILLDIAMPGLDGLEVISRIRALKLSSKILVLTAQPASFYAMRCMKAGAAGYISKTDDLSELSKAIKALMASYTYFPNLVGHSVRRCDVDCTEMEMIRELSDRELIILQQLARGLSNKEIGDAMLLSNKTVSTYKTRLIEKLNVKSVVYLADFAKRNNLV